MEVINKFKRIIQYLIYPIHFNSKNKLYDKPIYNSNEIKIYGMYHVYCSNLWKELFQEQLNMIKKSGLFELTTKLFISIITTTDEDIKYIKSVCKENKIIIISLTKDATKYEYPALEYIKSLAAKEEFYVYYFHTKGISINLQTYKNYARFHTRINSLKRNTDYWRKMMEYWNFSKYNIAINVLQAGYDTYGAYIYVCKQYTYYTGNFWWARSDYIANKLHNFTEEEKKSRYSAEIWLLSKNNMSYCPFYCISELYACPLYESIYKKKFSFKNISIFLFYHYRYCFHKLIDKISSILRRYFTI